MPTITKDFFLYDLQLNDGCVLTRAASEIPAERLQDFSLAVSDVANVTRKRGIYRYEDEERLRELIKHWKERDDHFEPMDIEEKIRHDLSGDDVHDFEGIPFRIVYQYASW